MSNDDGQDGLEPRWVLGDGVSGGPEVHEPPAGVLPPPPVEPPFPGSDDALPPPPLGPPAQAPIQVSSAPSYVADPEKKRSKGKLIALVAGGVALLGAGTIGVAALMGGGSDGGAANPEEAIEKLFAAANDQDVLGVLDMVLPSERSAFGDPLVDMFAEAKRLEVLSTDADLAAVEGLNVEFKVTTGTPQEVADDITIVRVKGSASAAVDLQALPIGKLLIDHGVDVSNSDNPDRSKETLEANVATVKRGGRWYVSLGYSVAENIRQRLEEDWPTPAEGVQAKGYDDPEAAVTAMLEAFENTSLEDVIAGINPNEAEVLQRVARWFLADAQDAIDNAVRDAEFKLTFVDSVLTATKDGDRATVRVGEMGVDVQFGGGRIHYEGGCITITPPEGESTKQCLTSAGTVDPALADQFGLGDLADDLAKVSEDLGKALSGMDDLGIVVDRVDGKWYVSPLGTGFEFILDLMRALDRQEIDQLIDDVEGVVDGIDDGFSDAFSDSFSDSFSDGFSDSEASSGVFACESSGDFDIALKCVTDGVASGEIPRELVSGIYLVPECGWRGLRFTPSLDYPNLSSLPDADYVQKATAAAACFDGKIAGGVITEAQRPFELIKVECLLGKNPSNMSPQEASDYFSCQLPG